MFEDTQSGLCLRVDDRGNLATSTCDAGDGDRWWAYHDHMVCNTATNYCLVATGQGSVFTGRIPPYGGRGAYWDIR